METELYCGDVRREKQARRSELSLFADVFFSKTSKNLSQYIRCRSRDSIRVLQVSIARLHGAFNGLEAKPYCTSFGLTSNRTVN